LSGITSAAELPSNAAAIVPEIRAAACLFLTVSGQPRTPA
jgi:hypothetical protein